VTALGVRPIRLAITSSWAVPSSASSAAVHRTHPVNHVVG
jgi:hypothetical protein